MSNRDPDNPDLHFDFQGSYFCTLLSLIKSVFFFCDSVHRIHGIPKGKGPFNPMGMAKV